MLPYAKKHLLYAGSLLFVLTIIFLWRGKEERQPIHYASLVSDRPDVTLDGFTIQCLTGHTRDGWQLLSKRGYVFQEKGLVTCTDITFRILNQGKQVGLLLAQRGEVDQSQQLAWLHGTVAGTYAGMELNGSEFCGILDQKRVQSNKPVTVKHRSLTCTAQSCSLAIDKETILLWGGVHSEFNS